MQAIAIPLSAFLALVSIAALPARSIAAPQGGGLQRVMPQEGADDPGEDLFAQDFDPARWRTRLATTDLDRRERAYEALLQRAGFDPTARLFLEELARDPDAGELGWTARLALRELGRARFGPMGRLPGGILRGQNPLEGLMQELLRRDDAFPFGTPFAAPAPGPGARSGTSFSGRSIHLRQESGRTVLEVVEQVDGQEQRTRYEGESLDAILEANPELARELGGLQLRVGGGAPLDLDLALPPGLRDLVGGARGLQGLPVTPQRPTQPVTTEKFGIIAQPLTAEHARELGLDGGLFVERTATGTYAHLLGIGTGDVLVEIDGQPVHTVEDVGRVMAGHDPARPIRATWIDELGQRRNGAWPPENAPSPPR